MALTIALANAIRFRPVNEAYPNIDNTFDLDNEVHNRLINNGLLQRYQDDNVTIQAKSSTGDAVTCRAWYNNAWTDIAASIVITPVIGLFDYTQFILPFSAFTTGYVYFEITDGTELLRSEVIECGGVDSDYLKIEWFNQDNGFEMNYVGGGIVPLMYVYGNMQLTPPSGESVVYSNQGHETKLKEIVQRTVNLECYVQAYVAEQLALAMAHDRFFINEVEFVTSKKPSFAPEGNSNIYKFTAELVQKNVIGLNTHDVGFDPDSGLTDNFIMNSEILNMTGNSILNIPAGYLLHTITCIWLAGANFTIKAGTSGGADDVMQAIAPIEADNPIVASIHHDNPDASVIFFTMSAGTGSPAVNIYVQLIKNRV